MNIDKRKRYCPRVNLIINSFLRCPALVAHHAKIAVIIDTGRQARGENHGVQRPSIESAILMTGIAIEHLVLQTGQVRKVVIRYFISNIVLVRDVILYNIGKAGSRVASLTRLPSRARTDPIVLPVVLRPWGGGKIAMTRLSPLHVDGQIGRVRIVAVQTSSLTTAVDIVTLQLLRGRIIIVVLTQPGNGGFIMIADDLTIAVV